MSDPPISKICQDTWFNQFHGKTNKPAFVQLVKFKFDYIFILRDKEKSVNSDHSMILMQFQNKQDLFIIPLHGIRFGAIIQSLKHDLKYRNIMPKALVFTNVEESPSDYFLKGPRWIWEKNRVHSTTVLNTWYKPR